MADRDSWCLIALVLAYAACAGSSWSGEACASPKSALKQINTLSSPQVGNWAIAVAARLALASREEGLRPIGMLLSVQAVSGYLRMRWRVVLG